MHRIDHPTAGPLLPAPGPAGTPGFFNPDTVLTKDWANAIQEELVAIVEAGGLTLSKTIRTQVRDALRALFGGTGLLGATGYMRLPGGLIAQWGNNATAPTGNVNFAFPIAFPTAVTSIQITEGSASGWGSAFGTIYGVTVSNAGGFEVRCQAWTGSGFTGAGANFFWLALGY
jgi:hypothetical protein